LGVETEGGDLWELREALQVLCRSYARGGSLFESGGVAGLSNSTWAIIPRVECRRRLLYL